MVTINETVCPNCGGGLRYYDEAQRIVRTSGGNSKWVNIRRLKCDIYGLLHRELPVYLTPYKHYDCEIINGVVEGYITSDTLGYEDYPCETTMQRWVSTLN